MESQEKLFQKPGHFIMSRIFDLARGITNYGLKISYVEVFLLYLRYITIAKETVELQGQVYGNDKVYVNTESNSDIIYYKIVDELPQNLKYRIIIDEFKGVDLFEGIKNIKWNDIRIGKQALQNMFHQKIGPKISQDDLHDMINTIIFISRGIFTDSERLNLSQMCFCDAFMMRHFIKKHANLAFIITPRRIPLIQSDAKDKQTIKGFKFIQFIDLFPFVNQPKENLQIHDTLRSYITNQHKNDHDCFLCFKPNYILYNIPIEKRYNTAFGSIECIVEKKIDSYNDLYIYLPKKFVPQLLTDEFASKYKKVENGRWFYADEFDNISDKFKRANEDLVDVVSANKGAIQLLRLIKSIPKLKFNLTPEQEKMISTPSNLLCLGRSGTGKTTSQALRLFSTDVFYKYMEELKRFKINNPDKLNSDFKVDPQFLNIPSTLKLVFVTASPVLTNEVKKFYNDMKDHMISELIKRRERRANVKNDDDLSIIDDEDLESSKGEISTQADQKDIEDYIKMEQDQLIDDEELEKLMKLPSSMDYLNNDHFPLFVTVKRLILMMDASLNHSFFSRNAEGHIIGMDNNVQWHNESRGVYMINQYYKQSHNYDEKIKRLGTKLIQIDEQFETDMVNQLLADITDDDDKAIDENEFNISQALGSIVTQPDSSYSFSIKRRQLGFEVDFDTFKTRFWPKVANWTKIQPLVVWTEIYSLIKGSADSFKYNNGAIPASLYVDSPLQKTKLNSQAIETASFLTIQEKLMIYQIFMHYEKWKEQMAAYDFMDVVNHVIIQTRLGFKQSQQIHFLMVDEVQDLTPNLLQLFTKMTDRNIFFCGDTAQTIAKGVGFRFYDLKKVFQANNKLNVPSVLQLTQNFRSHSRILDLANSVVSLIELLFPKTIDKLQKESSTLDGPKPIFIDPAQPDKLQQLLLGKTSSQLLQNDKDSGATNQAQFGCNQVIIVRDQESKLYLPDFLQNMLCLTVYEAKGLEFDDVILYNFFKDSKCGSQWMLLKDVAFKSQVVKKKFKDFEFLNFDSLDIPSQQEEFKRNDKCVTNIVSTEEEEVLTQLFLKRARGEVYRQFAQLCNELKFLYVAITRPKNVLLIYDDDLKLRQPLQEFLLKQSLISHISKDMIQNPALLTPEIQAVLCKDLDPTQTTNEAWKLQGLSLFKKKFYHSAIQCFRNSGDQQLEVRCMAYQHADKAGSLMGEAEQKIMQSKNKAYKKNERNDFLKEAKYMRKEANKQFEIAGTLFQQIAMHKHAAQCFCSANLLDKAGDMFENQQEHGQAAECFLKVGNYKKAAQYYALAGLFANAFECYEILQDWEGLLICLSKYKDFFKKEERESLIEKYFPIALNSLYQLYTNFNPMAANIGLDEENKGKLQEMKIKMKFQNNIAVIQEVNEDAISDEDEENDEEDDDKPENDDEESNLIQNQEVEEEVKNNQDNTIEIIDTSSRQNDEQIEEEKFDNDNKVDQQKVNDNNKSERFDNDYEILSSIDPDDEFLKSDKSVSLIESIVSKTSESFSIISSQNSEFSMISNSKMHSIIQSIHTTLSIQDQQQEEPSIDLKSQISTLSQQCQSQSILENNQYSVIENYKDDYVEDIVMQKIIFYVSLFSEDVKNRLHEMRSKDNLLDQQQNSHNDNNFILIDLDNISQELLYLILDTLEHYELFRLCLIICNRYSLKSKFSRYLISIGHKYSNLKNFKYTYMRKFTSKQELQKQKDYSKISHEIMHNVLSMIEKEYLNIDDNGKDSLNIANTCFNELFLQGYWKKLVFLMDCDSALQLSFAMNDDKSFKLLYLVYKCGIKEPRLLQQIVDQNDHKRFQDAIHSDFNHQSKYLANEVSIFQEVQELKNVLIQKYKLKQDTNWNEQYLKETHHYLTKKYFETFKSQSHYHQTHNEYGCAKKFTGYLFGLVSLSIVQPVTTKFFQRFKFHEIQELNDCVINMLKLILNKANLNQGYKKFKKIQGEIRRVAFRQFGITMLEGLDIFSKLNNEYAIVSNDSPFMKYIQLKQEKELVQFNNITALNLYEENQSQFMGTVLNNYVLQQMNKVTKNLDSNISINEYKLGFSCDLNLEYHLVPIAWVDEIISIYTVSLILIIILDEFFKNANKYQLT